MANTTTGPAVIKRTVYLKFLTAEGKIYTVRLNCASPKLAGAEGAALVKRTMERILAINPFSVRLVKVIGAEVAERSVLSFPDEAADGGEDLPERESGARGGKPPERKEPEGAIQAAAFGRRMATERRFGHIPPFIPVMTNLLRAFHALPEIPAADTS